MASSHNSGTTVKSAPIRGMWAKGSRSSSHCENPASDPIRYRATKPISTPQATGVSRGATPNNKTVTADNSHTAGSWTAALPTTMGSLAATSPAETP